MLVIKGPQGRINRAVWGPLNNTIISAGEDAVVRIWDSEVSVCLNSLVALLSSIKLLSGSLITISMSIFVALW